MVETDLEAVRGDRNEFRIRVIDPMTDGPYVLTGAQMWFTGKASVLDPDNVALFQKTVGAGITIDNAAQGLATVVLNPVDTNAIVPPANLDARDIPEWKGVIYYDCQVKTAGGDIFTTVKGRIHVSLDITRTTT